MCSWIQTCDCHGTGLTLPPTMRVGRGYAYVGLLLSGLCAGVPLYHYEQAQRVPAIHDITTDTEHPPTFVALAAARQPHPMG